MPWIVMLVCLLFASGVEAQEWTVERDTDPLTELVSLSAYLGFSHGYLGKNRNNRITSYIKNKKHTEKEILESYKRPWETSLRIVCARLEKSSRTVISVVVIADRRYFISESGMAEVVWKFDDAPFQSDKLKSEYSTVSKIEHLEIGSHISVVPRIFLSDLESSKTLQFRIEKGLIVPDDWTVTFDLSRSEPVIKEVLGVCGDSAKTD